MINILEKYPPLEFNYFLKKCNEFNSYTSTSKKKFILEVINIHPLLNYEMFTSAPFFRVRIVSDKKIDNVQDVLWPPQKLGTNTRFGNLCYMSNSDRSALTETEIKDGQIAVVVRFKLVDNVRLKILPIGETDMIARSGVGYITNDEKAKIIQGMIKNMSLKDYDKTLTFIMQDSFLFQQLIGKDRELSQFTFNSITEKLTFPIDLISYPSVKYRGGLNFGVIQNNFWDKWQFFSISKIRVNVLPFGYFKIKFLEHVTSIDKEGKLFWENHNPDNGMNFPSLLPVI